MQIEISGNWRKHTSTGPTGWVLGTIQLTGENIPGALFITQQGQIVQRIKDEVQTRAFPIPAARTIIDYATLGGDAGYIGAAGCARLRFGRTS